MNNLLWLKNECVSGLTLNCSRRKEAADISIKWKITQMVCAADLSSLVSRLLGII